MAGLSLSVCAATLSAAADVDFRPTLTLWTIADGNTAVVGDASGNGDFVASLAANLAVSRTTPGSDLTFSYRPSYVAYADQSDLNYFGQSADLAFTKTASRQSRYTFDLNSYRTEHQGVRPSSPSDPVTFVVRSMQTHVGARFHGTHEGRRNIFDWEVRGTLEDYSVNVGDTSGGPPTCTADADCNDGNSCTTDVCNAGVCQHPIAPECVLENSWGAGALAGWRYQVSENDSVGLGLNVDGLFYENLPNVYVETLGLVGSHTFSRATMMNYAAGVSRTDSSGTSSTNFACNLTVSRSISDVSSLTAGLRQSVSAGSGLGGVSLDTGGYVGYAHTQEGRGLTGSVTAGYWRRDPVSVGSAAADTSTATLSASGVLGWNFSRFLTFNVAASVSDQSASGAALDTRYGSYGLNLVWNIRGR